MSNSPFKQSDRNLIEWQYRSSQAEHQMGKVTHDGIMQIFDALGEWGNFKKRQSGDYSDEMNKILDSNTALGPAEYDNAYRSVSGDMYNDYVNGDPQTRTKKLQELQNLAAQYDDYDKTMVRLASDYDAGNISKAMGRSPLGRSIFDLTVNPDIPKVVKHNDEIGVIMTDHEAISDAQERLRLIEDEIKRLEEENMVRLHKPKGMVHDEKRQIGDTMVQLPDDWGLQNKNQ